MSASKAVPSPVQIEQDAENYHVFISYRHGACGNRNINQLVLDIQLQLMLKAKGLHVFVDKSGIPVGDKWRGKFMAALKQAQVLMLLITRNTMSRYERPSPPKTDIVSVFSGMLASGVQALTQPLVSLAGGVSDPAPLSPSAGDGVDNVLLEWMLALALHKIVVPIFIGDSDHVTGNVGGLLEQGVLQNVWEPPAHVFDSTRAYASAFLASEFDPPVLLPECCSSLTCMIHNGILALNGVTVKSVAWEVVPDVIVSNVLQSPLLRGILEQLPPPRKIPGMTRNQFSYSDDSSVVSVVKSLLPALNSAADQGSAETLYESCFLQSQRWPHATHGKTPRRRGSIGFSLFIAEPEELRGTSVDLLPPGQCDSSFWVYITRSDNPECREFEQTWSGNCCTLQLPYVDSKCWPYISRHHATLRYTRNAWERSGIGLADGHFNFCPQEVPPSLSRVSSGDCPCQLLNPDGKTCSVNGTFVLSCPPAGKESRVIMRKRIFTAAEVFEINRDGGFVALDSSLLPGGGTSFMYFMLGHVVIGISDSVTTCPQLQPLEIYQASPAPKFAESMSPPAFNTKKLTNQGKILRIESLPSEESLAGLQCALSSISLGDGTVNGMEQEGWEKMISCWSN